SYLKMCHTGPDLVKCAIANGNAALPELLKGNEELKIPNMLPLSFPEILTDTGNLRMKFNNLEVHGLDTVTLTDFRVDFDKRTIYVTIHADKLEIRSQYDVDGKVLILPIKGNGKCVVELENGDLEYTFKYRLEDKNGVEYSMVEPDDVMEFKIEKAHYNFENLFNGNKQLGDNVNKFMNEHPQEFLSEFSGTIKATLTSIARDITRGVFQNIPFKDLFIM
ncbi:hypothetical protein GWI33_010474, partial [Rhynchophorus ferrugineus]